MLRQKRREYELNRNIEILSQKTPIAFFDIDGTLAEGFAIFSFAEYLADRGSFKLKLWKQMQADFEIYKVSVKGEKSYRKFAIDLVDHYARGLKGQRLGQIKRKGELFFKEVRAKKLEGYRLFEYTEELVRLMRGIGKTIAISGSPIESLLPLKESLSFDEIRATTLEAEDDCFTGGVLLNLAIDTAKKRVVGEYLDKMDIECSFAFGDSPHDLPILEAVANPFVLGNNQNLQRIGRERGWFVVSDGGEIINKVKNQVELLFETNK